MSRRRRTSSSNSSSLELVEQVLKQLGEMQNEIERLTTTNENLNEQLTEQQSRIEELQQRQEEYQKAMTRTSADADDQCRRMLSRMQNAKDEAADLRVRIAEERQKMIRKIHHYNVVVMILIAYAAVMTIIMIGGVG